MRPACLQSFGGSLQIWSPQVFRIRLTPTTLSTCRTLTDLPPYGLHATLAGGRATAVETMALRWELQGWKTLPPPLAVALAALFYFVLAKRRGLGTWVLPSF